VLLTRARLPVPQSELGDVVYVELPAVGATLTAGKTFGVVESVKVSPSPVAPPP
jgi:glycine cleavage system H protein